MTVKKDCRLGIVGGPGGIKAVWHRELPEDATIATAIVTPLRRGLWRGRQACSTWVWCASSPNASSQPLP